MMGSEWHLCVKGTAVCRDRSVTLLCMRPATAGDLNCNEEIAAALQRPAIGYWSGEKKHGQTGETVSANIEAGVNWHCVIF